MIDLMGKRKFTFALSILVILAGMVAWMIFGLQLDIQFQGGTLVQMQMNDDKFDAEKAGQIAEKAINKKVSAQKLQTYNAEEADKKVDMLMLKVASEDTLTGDELTKLQDAIKKEFNVQSKEIQVQSVEPSIGREMLQNGIYAAVISSLLIIIYIWLRFRVMSLSAAMFAVVALVHDSLVMFSVYTIFQIPINESFIAAILTILGYSINDTIIIYDRIRENSSLLRKVPVDELVNRSVVQTLSRTINTQITVTMCIVTVYVFSAVYNITSLREFSFPLIIGMIAGSYSSIFIASPLWMMWKQAKAKKRVAAKEAKI